MQSVVKGAVSRVGRRVYEGRGVELESRARGKMVAIIDLDALLVALLILVHIFIQTRGL